MFSSIGNIIISNIPAIIGFGLCVFAVFLFLGFIGIVFFD